MNSLYPQCPVLLVDDEATVLESLETALNLAGVTNTHGLTDSSIVIEYLKTNSVCVIIMDLLMPGVSGMELLGQIHEAHPEVPVIVVTGVNEVRSAVDCMKLGAKDYLIKPVERNELIASVKHSLELIEAKQEVESLKDILFARDNSTPSAYENIVGAHAKMTGVFKYLHAIRFSRKPVLITGETGVGKDLLARAYHNDCGLPGDFVTVNVAGLDDNMFSDTLFGHTKGAFTGATNSRRGQLREAQGGTIFLDEIGDMSVSSQIKLLRLVQNGEYLPLGSETTKISDARIVCATNADLDELMKAGSFRKDLYYRLKTHHVRIPALRERKSDIPLLINHFLETSAEQLNKSVPTPPPELYPMLKNYPFPGNVRELESIVHEAVSLHSKGVLSLDVFRRRVADLASQNDLPDDDFSLEDGLFIPSKGTFPSMEEIERYAISEALEKAEGNQSLAAQFLGISRHTIMRKTKQSK